MISSKLDGFGYSGCGCTIGRSEMLELRQMILEEPLSMVLRIDTDLMLFQILFLSTTDPHPYINIQSFIL